MADTVYYCPYCDRHSCRVAVHVEDKCEAAQIADAADEMVRLRLALDTATRERDEARACIQIVREDVEAILANHMRPPGGQQAGCPYRSISPSTCRRILRSLGPEQGSYTYGEWLKLTAERGAAVARLQKAEDLLRSARRYHDAVSPMGLAIDSYFTPQKGAPE